MSWIQFSRWFANGVGRNAAKLRPFSRATAGGLQVSKQSQRRTGGSSPLAPEITILMISLVRKSLRWVWIRKSLRRIALAADSPEEMRMRASKLASHFRESDIPLLSAALWSLEFIPVIKSVSLNKSQPSPDLGATSLRKILFPTPLWPQRLSWASTLYLAVFEVFYSLRERGVGELERVAQTEYRLSALETLALLAIEGVRVTETSLFIVQCLDELDAEEIDLIMPVLGKLCACSPSMADGVENFLESMSCWDPIGELECLLLLQPHAPDLVQKRTDSLEAIMLDNGPEPRHIAMAVHTPEDPFLVIGDTTFPRLPDLHAISAALTILALEPERTEVLSAVHYWKKDHPIEEFRGRIAGFFKVDWMTLGCKEPPRQSPEWEDLKYSFADDGMLRDIHIVDMSAEEYPNFFAFIKIRMDSVSYLINDEPHELPGSFEEYNSNAVERHARLSMSFGEFDFNCHSYGGEEIEIDFWPWSVRKGNFEDFLSLLVDLGRAVSRDVTLTHEGYGSKPEVRYCHRRDLLFQLSENLNESAYLSQEELDELAQRDA